MEKNNNINPDSMIPMYKQIVNLLNEKIEKGELKPGDKLPSEAELMEAYSVSNHSFSNQRVRRRWPRNQISRKRDIYCI